MENRSTVQILTTISFGLDVRLSPVINRDARNLKRKLVANAYRNNFNSDVRLIPVIYQDAGNGK